MSEPTFVGKVFVFGLDGTLQFEGIGTTENEPQSLTYKDEIKRHDTMDKKGRWVGTQLWNPVGKITIKFLPCSGETGDGQIAIAKTKIHKPTAGSKVTLAGFPPDTEVAEGMINSTRWIYFGGGDWSFNNEKELEITMNLELPETDLAVNNT